LNLAFELIATAIDRGEIVICELALVLFHLAFDLFPISFNARNGPRRLVLRPLLHGCFLELDPNTLTPVASPFMLTPTILIGFSISPPPIVAVDVETKFGAVLVFLFDVPAIAFLIANDRGRRTCRSQSKNAECSERGTYKILHSLLLTFFVMVLPNAS
jgi:hypothetical protein